MSKSSNSELKQIEEEKVSETFVTEPKEQEDDKVPNKAKQVVTELDKCVEGINDQFVQVLLNHENDFMSAYRVSYPLFKCFIPNTGPHDQS